MQANGYDGKPGVCFLCRAAVAFVLPFKQQTQLCLQRSF